MRVELQFLGAAQNVTGSRYLVQADGTKVLVDCGLYQERQYLERNWDEFPIRPADLDAVLLTHAHLDHCGWLPRLVREGFSGPVYCTAATRGLAQIVLRDAGKLQEEDAAYKRKRHAREGRQGPRPVEPLYTAEDAAACDELFQQVSYGETVKLSSAMSALWRDAGHILGAASIRLTVRVDHQQRVLAFSGDVGRWDRPILEDPQPVGQADYVLVESTYGDRLHQDHEGIKAELARVINETRARGGNVVIPSFAIERAQEVLYYLNALLAEKVIPPLLVFLDSPMAVRATEVFQKHPELYDEAMRELVMNGNSPFDFPGLQMARTATQSKAINELRGTAVIIAGSGMCTGGRIKHHLVNNISRPESTILFVGYQARGTLGRQILEGEDPVRILGESRPVKATIERIHGFSAHADQKELIQWLKTVEGTPRQVFVTHGEPEAAQALSERIGETLGWATSVPAYKDKVVLK